MLLGEAQSKVEHIAGVPLQPDVARRLHQLYLAKGALATTAIEGNTLTEEEALGVVEGHSNLPPSKGYLKTEIENIVRACNEMLAEIANGTLSPLTPDLICKYNREVLRGLTPEDPRMVPGEMRAYSVGVGRYRAAPAGDCGHLLDRLCDWLNGAAFRSPDGRWTLVYAIIRAVIAHLYVAWIHPFGDGNGRTARLVEFRILVSSGFPVPAAHLLSDHYNRTRREYYRRLESSRGEGVEADFMTYALEGLVDGLRHQLDLIRQQQLKVIWHDYVHEVLGGPGRTEHRQRALVFALSGAGVPVALDRIASLTPQVAAAYATRSVRTLARDLAALTKTKLVERTPAGHRARPEIILAFLPLRHHPATAVAATESR